MDGVKQESRSNFDHDGGPKKIHKKDRNVGDDIKLR